MEILENVNLILNQVYPIGTVYQPTVSQKNQDATIVSLKSCIPFEQFFLVLNLADRKLEYVNGFEKWLGYRDDTFSFFDYIKIIHPSHLPSLNTLASSAFSTAHSGDYKLGFMSHSISIQLPLRHISGKYILTKRRLYPFQIDKSGKVLSYLNHYVILKEFDERDALEPRVTGATKKEDVIIEQVLEKSKKSNSGRINWSKKELEILKLVGKQPNLTHREIAEKLQINPDTLRKTDNHRITRKAKEFFHLESFSSVKDVALFLKNQGYL